MDFKNTRESTNYTDETGGVSGLAGIKNNLGLYLYHHGWVKGADKQYYDPAKAAAYEQYKNTPMPPLDAQGRRADIDWGSNARLPAGLMSQVINPSPTATPVGSAPAPVASSGVHGVLNRLWQMMSQ